MVKLKAVVDDLVEVRSNLREFYTRRDDGKFVLTLDGDPPGYAKADKLAEFRDNNRALNSKVTDLETRLKAFDGIDPEEYQTLKARPDLTPRVTELEAQLAAEKAATTAAQRSTDAAVLRSKIGDAFHRAGGRPQAQDFIIAKAAEVFSLDNGVLTTQQFSTNRPGEPLTVDEWVGARLLDSAFAFLPSSGGGASPSSGPPAKRIVSSDPLEFGQNLEAIAKGEVIVS